MEVPDCAPRREDRLRAEGRPGYCRGNERGIAMTEHLYSGIWPVAPTPFTDDGGLDIEGMRRVIDCMVDQGVDGV